MEPNETKEVLPTKSQEATERDVADEYTRKEKFYALLASIGTEGKQSRRMFFSVLAVVVFASIVSFELIPPAGFPVGKVITVKSGDTLGKVSLLLKDGNFIRSQMLFEFCAKTIGGDKGARAGQYVFKTPLGACSVALRIVSGISGIPAIRITIPEGLSDKEVAAILGEKLQKFDSAHFVEHARTLEGYLFPDTYFFLDGVTPEEVEVKMKTNFDKKIEGVNQQLSSSRHSLREIIIMASILEREATTEADRYLVSGVLWNRIENGMPLQVDAPFLYLLGKKSSELTQADMQIKSAYNTYRNKGLPGGPIGNPGLAAILAAANPKESPYVYYLSDNDGVMHYAKTFSEHVANKQKYLK